MHLLKMDGITGHFHSVILLIAFVAVNDGRVVKVPVGPLVHVEGQAVSIHCNVSEYQGPRDQDFEWSMIQSGDKLLHLISTFDDGFMDPTVRDRVNSGDISYKKLGDDSVELRFKKVRATDSGVYHCSTPSTDSVISGNYHADVELKVVVNDGRVVKVPVGPLVHVEGQAVSIHCNVSDYEGPRDQDFEWSMIQSGDKLLHLVSTFDDNFMDPTVRDRVNSGDISYKKLGNDSVELRFKKVRATDSGVYRCSTPSTDSVISGNYHADVELKVIGDSLKVSTAIPKSAVSEGESVELQCNTTRGFTEHTFLSVSWSIKKESGLLEEILAFGPDDKIKVGSNYTQRYTDGGLRLDLPGGGFYGLVLKSAKPSDQGEYVCTVQEWVRQGEEGRNWRKILEKSEEMGKVVVKPTGLHATNDEKTKRMMEDVGDF